MNAIDHYIASCAEEMRPLLEQIRQAIRESAPGSIEVISYGMPAFKKHGVLVYFAAAKNHIGFYPTASGIEKFRQEFHGLVFSKGAVQFPLAQPLPLELIQKITRFRLLEDEQKFLTKKIAKKKS